MAKPSSKRRTGTPRPGPAPARAGGPPGRRDWLAGAACAGVAGAITLILGRVRFMDRDEGFYAMAADLVRHGQWPWRDFLFPQGALFPFLLAPFGADVFALRWTSAVFTALLVFALAVFLSRRHSAGVAVLASLLLMTEHETATWLPTLKTYAPAGCFSVAASVLVASAAGASRFRNLLVALAGILLGIGALIRIPCVALLVPLALWLPAVADRRKEALVTAFLLAAACVGTVAAGCLALGASGPQILFNAIMVHQRVIADSWGQRLSVIKEVLSNPQTIVLVAAAVAGVWRRKGPRWNSPANHHLLAAVLAALLTVGYWAIDLTYAQYFTFAVPFWIWAGAPFWARVTEQIGRRQLWPAFLVAAWILLTVLPWRAGTPLSPYPHQRYFAIDQVQEVRRFLASLRPPGSTVASVWPGYVSGTGQLPLRGMESTISFETADHLPESIRAGMAVMSLNEFARSIEAGTPAAVVINAEDMGRYRLGAAGLEGYESALNTGDVVVMVKRKVPARR